VVSVVMDWRFAQHVDLYAGVSYSEKCRGLANGYVLSTANGVLTDNTVFDRVSTWDPGIGLRYRF
jgi:hypothetical protein